MPLYGNELDPSVNPYEAGLGRVVRLDKPADFVGRDALRRIAEAAAGQAARRPGHDRPRDRPPWLSRLRRRSAERDGHQRHAFADARRAIAMAYVAPGDAEPGTIVDVEIRDARVAAEVVPLPFYRRPR